jgi:hypothetical protein
MEYNIEMDMASLVEMMVTPSILSFSTHGKRGKSNAHTDIMIKNPEHAPDVASVMSAAQKMKQSNAEGHASVLNYVPMGVVTGWILA